MDAIDTKGQTRASGPETATEPSAATPAGDRRGGLGTVVDRHLAMREVRAARSTTPRNVVVVDDDRDNVDLVVMLLEAAGHAAVGATDGSVAVALVVQRGADTVVLDYMMPNLDGAAIGQALRADAATRHVKILMCSGTPEPAVRLAFTQYDAFLAKPASHRALLRAIERL